MRISDWSSDVCSSDLEANACFRHGESCPLSRDAIPRGKGYANAATHRDAVDECHNGLFIDEQQMVHPVFVEIKAFGLDTVGLGAVRQQANIAARTEAAALGMIDDDSADALILSPLKQGLVNGCHHARGEIGRAHV